MRVEEIKKLIKLVEESQIGELEVRRWWGTIRISRNSHSTAPFHGQVIQVPQPAVAPEASSHAAANAPSAKEAKDVETGLHVIRSPMVGTFYRAPAPDADPYVEAGRRVEPGQTVCIIEAMKLMNEIESEISGTIAKVLVENGQPVEYGQPLFHVRLD
jgi:acetyl-CoA carboxylase biotin carboxyl carrier protein